MVKILHAVMTKQFNEKIVTIFSVKCR